MTSASSVPLSSTLGVLSQNVNGLQTKITMRKRNLSSAVPELWFSSSGGVCVCVRVCREPLYL